MNTTNQFFLNILKAALRGEPFEPEIPAEEWGPLLKLAGEHQLVPVVFEACFRQPGFAGSQMYGMYKQQTLREVFTQTRKTGDFLALYSRLREGGITPLVVKGIICRNLYPQPDYRSSGDEDVLIPPEQFERCHQIMLEFGMETAEPEENFGNCYEVPYGKKGSPLYIELHKSLFPTNSSAYSELNRFFVNVHERAVEERIDGTAIMTMAPTDHLFYLICHAFKHFLHGGFGIRQVCDIVLYARQYADAVDWTQVLNNCESIRAEKFAAALFAIGRNHLDVDVPLPENWPGDVGEGAMLEDLLASGIYGGADMDRKHSSNMTLNAVARQKQGKDTGGGVLKSLFPSASSLGTRYSYLKKYPFLLPVAWISRIIRFALKNGGAEGAARTIQLGNERIELMKQYGILDE